MNEVLAYYLDMTLRIAVACVLGGVIGYERESMNRPAGFRTHILVCVGSALVMMTGEFINHNFGGTTDPARLGAQVVSGIGFLGAGTILRAGFNVRGLTTAASLWAVSCVGLACGIGFYVGALLTAAMICATLVYFKKIEQKLWVRNTQKTVLVRTADVNATVCGVSEVFAKYGIETRHIDFLGKNETGELSVQFTVKMPNCSIPELHDDIKRVEHVEGVLIE